MSTNVSQCVHQCTPTTKDHWTIYIQYLEGQLPSIIGRKSEANMADMEAFWRSVSGPYAANGLLRFRWPSCDWHPGWPRRGLELTSKKAPFLASLFDWQLALASRYIYSSMQRTCPPCLCTKQNNLNEYLLFMYTNVSICTLMYTNDKGHAYIKIKIYMTYIYIYKIKMYTNMPITWIAAIYYHTSCHEAVHNFVNMLNNVY